MLQQAGFHTISAAQYARFPGGSAKDLPSRPILITFDDGQLDSYRYADPILRQFGFRATMFVITDPVDRGNPFYLRWDEFRADARLGPLGPPAPRRRDAQDGPHRREGHAGRRLREPHRGPTAGSSPSPPTGAA